MLFYDKKSFHAPPRAVAGRLLELSGGPGPPPLEQAREWLVFAGQLEQAVRDGGGWPGIGGVTDRAAALFLDVSEGRDAHAARDAFRAALRSAATHLGSRELAFRIPEGYAWYALYPESHALTARRWARHNPGRPATVIGLLSIGSSLGAIVAEQLRRCGAGVTARHAVRPGGHPFRRYTELPAGLAAGTAFIIVDEGPGLSGSSMAGTAEALHQHGVAEGEIVFFPGHGKGPGDRAGARERRWWSGERCWCSAPRDHGFTAAGPRVFGGFAAVNGRLETLAAVKHARHASLAGKGLALPCRAPEHGWIAIEEAGRPLQQVEVSGEIQRQLAAYIAAAALHAYASGEPCGWKALRDGLPPLLHGDGRLSPGEWVQGHDGRLLKRNATGTDWEHDWTGPQSVLWDVAGAAVEWNMSERSLAAFLGALNHRFGIAAPPRALAFHVAGYCCAGLARARRSGDPYTDRYEARLKLSLEQLR